MPFLCRACSVPSDTSRVIAGFSFVIIGTELKVEHLLAKALGTVAFVANKDGVLKLEDCLGFPTCWDCPSVPLEFIEEETTEDPWWTS